jgi:hypothetical protein
VKFGVDPNMAVAHGAVSASAALTRLPNVMRFLPSARIVVLSADPNHRTFICSALSELGLSQVLPAASLSEARGHGSDGPVDLCVVDPRGLVDGAADTRTKILPNPFEASGTPAILIAEDTVRATLETAASAGYHVVLGLPVVPRLLYRRIGSILQKARRTGRQMSPALAAATVLGDTGILDVGTEHRSIPMLERPDD